MRWLGVAVLAGACAMAALAACGDDTSVSPAPVDAGVDSSRTPPDAGGSEPDAAVDLCPGGNAVDWPPGPYAITLTSTLPPDLAFDGPDGTIAIKDYFEPCAAKSRLLVIRSVAGWCGTCDWTARHTKRLMDDARFANRLELLDLVVADEDNMPPTNEAAKRWRAKVDFDGKVGIDAEYKLQTALLTRGALPAYVIIDTKTMQVRTTIDDPNPETFQNHVLVELASLDHLPYPDLTVPKLVDSTFTENEWDLIQGMRLTQPAPPADTTNEFADSPAAAALGKKLFSDADLGSFGTVSCATCHDPNVAFGDGLATSEGIGHVDRNAPSVALSAHATWQFWDGRAGTLWQQALGPFEAELEIQSSRLYVVKQIASRYAADYAAAFGPKYTLPDATVIDALPDQGKPGVAAYDGLSQSDKDMVTRIFVNAGKAIAAFERTFRVQPNALDAYAGGDTTALTAGEKHALMQFMHAGCPQCHWGPRLTDDAFHAVRFPTGRHDTKPDPGRADVLPSAVTAEFAASSSWSDDPSAARSFGVAASGTAPASMIGAFKTPSLRGVADSAPYGHGGTFTSLLDVSKHYGTRGENVHDDRAVGTMEPWLPSFDANAQASIPEILIKLKADVTVP